MNEIKEKNQPTITFDNEMKKIIREMYFPKSNEAEFRAFLFDAQAKGLDPLQKEIIPILFKGKTTTVVSRDGYVKKAKENPYFNGYRSQPIYENDEFTYEEDNDGFHYSFKTNGFKDRGALVGAFCHVHMEDPHEDTFSLVSYKEVRQNTPVWKNNPTFMTEKVAEVRALKPVCNLAGVCSDIEMGENITNDEEVIDADTGVPESRIIDDDSTLTSYFLNKEEEEGFGKEDILSELEELRISEMITDEYYSQIKEKAKELDDNIRMYQYDGE